MTKVGFIGSVPFSPDGAIHATATQETQVVLYEVATGRALTAFRSAESALFDACLDDEWVAATNERLRIRAWRYDREVAGARDAAWLAGLAPRDLAD